MFFNHKAGRNDKAIAARPHFYHYMKVSTNSIILLISALCMAACGQSYEEGKRQTAEELSRMRTQDSLAFKVGVGQGIDCLPAYVAEAEGLFDSLGVDIRLKRYTAQIKMDKALADGRLEAAFTDMVRAQRIEKVNGGRMKVYATNAHWQLIANRKARVGNPSQLKDKMIGMTRHSATDMLCDVICDSARLNSETVFKIQINNPAIRLGMLQNNEIDAVWLPEPYVTVARNQHNKVMKDTRMMNIHMGVLAVPVPVVDKDGKRKKQHEAFVKAYGIACKRINQKGVKHYLNIIAKESGISVQMLKGLPDIKFGEPLQGVNESDASLASKWNRL